MGAVRQQTLSSKSLVIMLLPTLDEIACRLGTDKSTLTTLPPGLDGFASRSATGQAFTVFYEEYFHRRRNEPVRLLEIGVLDGRSLAMWAEYFAAGSIYGLDIDPACRRFETERTKIFIGSQDDPAALGSVKAAVPRGFDIIIDDGSHYVRHVIASFQGLFDHLKPGGYYVIEDINVAGYADWGRVASNRGMTLRKETGGNNAEEMTRFLREIKARPDVAEFCLHQRAICFVRKRAEGDSNYAPFERGDKIENLFSSPRPLWWRVVYRLLTEMHRA